MKKLLTVAAVALLGLTGAAHAAVLDVTLGPSLSYGLGGSLSPNIDLQTFGGLSLTNAQVITPVHSVPNQFVGPTGPVFANSFLSVYAANQPPLHSVSNGTAIFTLGAGQNTFGFTWGTIDHYNTLIIEDSSSHTFAITGTDILNHLAGSVDGQTQSDVSFFDPLARIVSVELTSQDNSFEAANFGQSATPLPSSILMFGAALVGFGVLARRRQRKMI